MVARDAYFDRSLPGIDPPACVRNAHGFAAERFALEFAAHVQHVVGQHPARAR